MLFILSLSNTLIGRYGRGAALGLGFLVGIACFARWMANYLNQLELRSEQHSVMSRVDIGSQVGRLR